MSKTSWLLLVVLIAAILGALHGAATHAEAHTGYYTNAGNALNLREGPGGTYTIIGKVPAGAVVKAFGHSGNWLKLRVLSSGAVGWAWLPNFTYYGANPPPPPAQPSLQLCFDTTWAWIACSPYWIAKAVYDAARYYGVGYYWLMAVAACESAFNPYAVNAWSGVTGLFQYQPSTFYWFGGTDIWSVYDQAWTTARAFSRGLAYHWDCAYRTGYL